MNSHRIFGFLIIFMALLFCVLFSPIYGDEKEQSDSTFEVKSPVELTDTFNKTEKITGHRVIIYYFHRTVRCETCTEIERLTLEAINEAFEKELNTESIEIAVINIEEVENSHFTEEYKLNVQSVIVSDLIGSNERRWKNLDRIWDYVSDEEEFKEYIIEEFKEYIIDEVKAYL